MCNTIMPVAIILEAQLHLNSQWIQVTQDKHYMFYM
jgi:hypothetical protein